MFLYIESKILLGSVSVRMLQQAADKKEQQQLQYQHKLEHTLEHRSSLLAPSLPFHNSKNASRSPTHRPSSFLPQSSPSSPHAKSRDSCILPILSSPIQLLERTPITNIHLLFIALRLSHAFVTRNGRLVGMYGHPVIYDVKLFL